MSLAHATEDRWLDLNDLLRELISQGFLNQEAAERALNTRRNTANSLLHPLEFLASQHLEDLSRPGRKLDLEHLTLWLAHHAGQP